MKCGLLGRTLGHSYSPQIHALLGDYEYTLYEKKPEELEDFLLNSDLSGLNVTMPYKKAVIPYLDELTPIAAQLGAVNTIVRQDGRLIGHNTDYFGFLAMVKRSGLSPAGKKCLVLGSGGASRVAVSVLQEYGAEVTVISRSGENNYENLHCHSDTSILVNTTPVGMYPDTSISPVDLEQFPHLEGVLDVIYNPIRTQLLLDAEHRGIPAMNGLWMLVAQAKAAAEWFMGEAIPEEKIAQIHNLLRFQTQNIILIGMPGCGKSTVSQILANKTNRRFVDTDEVISRKTGKSIPDIFAESGEKAFRTLESEILSEYCKQSGLVIATGGGCVTQPRNHPTLRQNGAVFWLQRDVEKLPTCGRPLSQSQDLGEMYRSRAPLYSQFADFPIDNNGTPEDAANAILEVFR